MKVINREFLNRFNPFYSENPYAVIPEGSGIVILNHAAKRLLFLNEGDSLLFAVENDVFYLSKSQDEGAFEIQIISSGKECLIDNRYLVSYIRDYLQKQAAVNVSKSIVFKVEVDETLEFKFLGYCKMTLVSMLDVEGEDNG